MSTYDEARQRVSDFLDKRQVLIDSNPDDAHAQSPAAGTIATLSTDGIVGEPAVLLFDDIKMLVTGSPTPQPPAWPVCMAPVSKNDDSICGTTFVLRIGYRWPSGESVWSWVRDCKHKSGDYELRNAEGKLPQ